MNQRPFSPRKIAIHLGLFVITVFTTMLAGAELVSGKMWISWGLDIPDEYLLGGSDIWQGLPYSIAFLSFLTFHEFGHYFASLYHSVRATLPYYIPIFIPVPGILNIGSFGAVIRLQQIPESTRKYYDIGIAGPLAGFVISIFLLLYGFMNLPPLEDYVLERNGWYVEEFGGVPSEEMLTTWLESDSSRMGYLVGTSLLFELMEEHIPDDPTQVPNHFDLIHYPFLFVGYITLFFTALNLLPIGQLDGGHIVYGMFGRKTASTISRLAVVALLFFGGTGFLNFASMGSWDLLTIGLYLGFVLYVFSKIFKPGKWKNAALAGIAVFLVQAVIKWYFPQLEPNMIWLLYSWLVVRFVGLDHPLAYREHKVNAARQVLGWLAIIIFILCFTPNPLLMVGSG